MTAIKVAVDSAIFFFCFKSNREDIKPINMQKLLNHLSTAPHIPLSTNIGHRRKRY
jgi:hypothetical protein